MRSCSRSAMANPRPLSPSSIIGPETCRRRRYSRVRGWTKAARVSSGGLGSWSMTTQSTPSCLRLIASVIPAGPAPTIRTSVDFGSWCLLFMARPFLFLRGGPYGFHGPEREFRMLKERPKRNADIWSALAEWGCVCVGADEQAWRARPVAPGVIDAADDHRVAELHEHLIGFGDQVDLPAYAGEAVQRVGVVHGKSRPGRDFQCAADQSVQEGFETLQTRRLRPVAV